MGYGVYGSYKKRDMTVKLGWEIEGERSEFYEITFVHDEISEEGTHDFLINDVGVKPFKVSADTEIHCIMYGLGRNWEDRSTYYGYSGRPDMYNSLEQE